MSTFIVYKRCVVLTNTKYSEVCKLFLTKPSGIGLQMYLIIVYGGHGQGSTHKAKPIMGQCKMILFGVLSIAKLYVILPKFFYHGQPIVPKWLKLSQ